MSYWSICRGQTITYWKSLTPKTGLGLSRVCGCVGGRGGRGNGGSPGQGQ